MHFWHCYREFFAFLYQWLIHTGAKTGFVYDGNVHDLRLMGQSVIHKWQIRGGVYVLLLSQA